jgi:hypothetical protein
MNPFDRFQIPVYDGAMATPKKNDPLKKLLKTAISELIEENEALVRRILEEAIEDAFLTNAMKSGRKTRKVSRARIFRSLSA